MASEPKLLQLTPEQTLSFDSSNFSQVQTRKLVLENISKSNVAFKIKTTALKAYLVRPSNAIIPPGQKKEVSIMLQKLTERPKNHDHRFLVQALATTQSEIGSKDEWTQLQKSNTVQEFRLSVVFPDSGPTLTSSSYDNTADSRDLRSKYEELAAYTQKLETQKNIFESDIKKLEAQLPLNKKKGYQLWQIVAAVVFALFLAKVIERVMAGKK